MPKIIMKMTTTGSTDGIRVNNYVAGREYDVTDALAKAFISMGVADYVRVRKAIPVVPENKMVESSPDNKVAEGPNKIIEEAAELDNQKKVLRVYQLADELGVSSKKILRVAKKLGISVSAPASGLSKEEAEKIKSAL